MNNIFYLQNEIRRLSGIIQEDQMLIQALRGQLETYRTDRRNRGAYIVALRRQVEQLRDTQLVLQNRIRQLERNPPRPMRIDPDHNDVERPSTPPREE